MMDETDGWLLIGCVMLLGAAVVLLSRRMDATDRELTFLRTVVTEVDSLRAD
jgi:hypothetical protein